MKGFLIFLSFQVFFCRSDIIQVVPNNENGTVDVRGTVVGETILKVSLALSKNGNKILKYCNVFSTLRNSEKMGVRKLHVYFQFLLILSI